MQALIPLNDRDPWSVVGTGRTNDGPLDEIDIAVDRGSQTGRVSIRTMRRTGALLGPGSSVHGTATDPIAIANIAAGCLLLDALRADLPLSAMEEALERADAIARDRDGWDVTPLPLDGIDYALFTRNIPEGTVAHADLGWAAVAMWSRGPLHEGPFRLANINPDAGSSAR